MTIHRGENGSGESERRIGRTGAELLLVTGAAGLVLAFLTPGSLARAVGLAMLLGALAGLACLMRRERRARSLAEAACRKLQQDKYEFVATVSHELRTPLTAVFGFSQLLADESRPIDPERRRDYLRIMREQSRHLARIIEDAVDLSRIEDGRLTMRPVALAIHQALEGALTLLDSAADRDRVAVVVAPDTPSVWADQAEMEQVFDRLLYVALTQGERGGRVLVQAGPAADAGTHVAVTTSGLDLGSDAFAPLADTPEATALWRNGERFMSLAAARAILELHGGRIWTEHDGERAAICFHLPATETTPASSAIADGGRLLTGARETA